MRHGAPAQSLTLMSSVHCMAPSCLAELFYCQWTLVLLLVFCTCKYMVHVSWGTRAGNSPVWAHVWCCCMLRCVHIQLHQVVPSKLLSKVLALTDTPNSGVCKYGLPLSSIALDFVKLLRFGQHGGCGVVSHHDDYNQAKDRCSYSQCHLL